MSLFLCGRVSLLENLTLSLLKQTSYRFTRRAVLKTLPLPFVMMMHRAVANERNLYERYISAWTTLASGQSVPRKEIEELLDSSDNVPDPVDLGSFSAAKPHLDVLFDALRKHIAQILDPSAKGLPALEDRGQVFAWTWSYVGRAAIILWKATGQERFRTLFVDAARQIMALRDDRTGRKDEVQDRVVRSWGSPWPVHGVTRRITDVTVTGLVSLPIASFANELYSTDPLADEFGSYCHDLTAGLWEFDRYFLTLPDGRNGYYRSWLDPKSFEAQNHVHALAAAGVEIYRVTNDRGIHDRLSLLWGGFKRVTNIDDMGAATWAYFPDPSLTQEIVPEAFWKAAVTLEFPLACQHANILVSDKDMRAFGRIYTKNVLLSDETYNILIGLRDPASTYRWDGPLASPDVQSLMPFIFRGLWFSDHEPSLTKRLTDLLKRHPLKFSNGLLTSPFGLMTRAFLWAGAA
ncbi:hypothetical protein [Microvirga rosea]|uniref:hypothetical protein n=1 Tax=Microvirga rosea TaxID=2715425 RepID=UPI001D0AAF78|nr:hypothetical protein [Microvirga rosea]MCB8820454.1 hypothetical protein [Microvirga rosea]